MKIQIVPYKLGSSSARDLANALTTLLGYKVYRSAFPKVGKRNLLWGYAGEVPNGAVQLQPKAGVLIARSKIKTFAALKAAGVPIPDFTTDRTVAQGWVNKGFTIFARTSGGQGGSGITVVEEGTVPAKDLYVKYIKKLKEYRVHVLDGKVIDVQEKRRKTGVQADNLIRSHDNGWVFCHSDIVEPADLRKVGVDAVAAAGLLFGAVDVIWNKQQNKCFVLEINSAPGLAPSSVERYAHAIKAL